MAALFTSNEPYLKKNRVKNTTYPELIVCRICQGILWLPKICQNCETPYCSSCIEGWKQETSQPIPCPSNCSGFIERKCSAAIFHILNTLELKCLYTSNGCNKISPYNSLASHEERCDYRQKSCSGCRQKIATMNFKDHYNECALVLLQCSECATFYQRQDKEKHSASICSQIQLHRAQDPTKKKDSWNAVATQKEKTSGVNGNSKCSVFLTDGDLQLIQIFLTDYDNSVTWQLTHEQNINRILRPNLEILFIQLGCNSYTDRCTRINNLITEYKEVLTIWRTHYKNIFKGLQPLLKKAVSDIRKIYGIENM